MAKQVTDEGPLEIAQPFAMRGTTQPMPALPHHTSPSAARVPTYQPTRWSVVNRGFELVDVTTNGRAGLLQRLITYLIIGGAAALVNLIGLAAMLAYGPFPQESIAHNVLAYGVAYEASILANFIPNDYFTFRHLSGHSRAWRYRCLRFHITSISGVVVTQIISSALLYLLGLPKLEAQAVALVLAVFFNFTVHHLFTYRHVAGEAE